MLVKLPPVKSFDANVPGLGRIQQILVVASEVRCSAVPFTKEKYRGHLFTVDGEDGGEGAPLFLFASPPAQCTFAPDAQVLIAKYEMTSAESLDLSAGGWWHHPIKSSALGGIGDRAARARASWHGAFSFSEEDADTGRIGLRTPQIGALHAILAHWSISTETATIVMPTGIGKTETMLSTLISAACERLLVIVPTDALRAQIAGKFETLGILKAADSKILGDAVQRPVVGTLKSRPKSIEEVATFFNQCNVIVATSQLVGGCASEVQARMCDLCSHLFIDEAHHSEASTWKAFRGRFNGKPVLQFTATPFREDGRKIEGKLIYVYPLRKAQAEGYFGAIRFRDVYEFDPIEGDRAIALAAMEEIEADTTRKHIVMARVGNTVRADEILALYQSLGGHQAVAIHSRLAQRERDCAKAKLFDGSARIVVCVDMLGEGFDLPELKIAAFHDIRKSLSVTLQLAGRFTRARADLGEPVFIANTARIDVREELRKLYTQDPDWNLLLPELSASAIDDEVASQHFFQGFDTAISEVPIKDIRPAASMVVYKTRCANWKPAAFRRGLPSTSRGSNVFYSINRDERTLVVLAASEHPVRWTDVESVFDWSWELCLAVWDKEKSLLYVHGSNNSGSYRELAKVLCGDDVQLIVAPELYRCFHNIKRLVLNNVGLDEHLGRNVRYTGRMGTDVEAQLGSSARRGAIKSVLAGKGFENGGKTSIGSAKRGRIWSAQRLRIDTFAQWAKLVGDKLIDDTIDPDEVLRGTLKPLAIGELPQKVAIAIDWPWEVLDRPESGTYFTPTGRQEESLMCVDIEPGVHEALVSTPRKSVPR